MRQMLAMVAALFLMFMLGSPSLYAQQQTNPIQPTPLEEAIAKIKPAVGTLYREIKVFAENEEHIKSYFDNGGTVTVFATNPQNSCAATVAHSTVEKDTITRKKTKPVKQPDGSTKTVIEETHRFSGRYLVSFDGQYYIDVELIASRGGAGLQADFAAFKVPKGDMQKVEFGDEAMVRVGTEVFMIGSPLNILGTATFGHVARHANEEFPITGSSLPIVKRVFVIDIRMTHGSSGAFIYVLRGNVGYAFSMLVGYFYVGTETAQLGDPFPNALGISLFKKFIEDEKILDKCK